MTPAAPAAGARFDDRAFRALIESISDVVAVLRHDGQVLYVSPNVQVIGGYRPEELIGTNWFALLHPESQREALRAVEALRRDPTGSSSATLRCRHRDGRWLTVETTARDCSGDKAVAGVVITLRDVTVRIAAEQALREEQCQRDALLDKLQRLHRTLDVAAAINALIVRARSQAELFQDAVRIAVELGGLAAADIAVMYEGVLVPTARYGRADVMAGDSSPGACVSLPLSGAGGVSGVLKLWASEKQPFHEAEIEVLQDLAANLAYALDHISKEQKLDYLALYDPLTRLPNRQLFLTRLGQFIAAACESGKPVTVAEFDVAQFKSLNDQVGRGAADGFLFTLAGRIKAAAGGPSFAGRMSGDKFAIVLQDCDAQGAARWFADPLWIEVTRPIAVDGKNRYVALWAGTATAMQDGGSAETLLANAELALKHGKARRASLVHYRPELRASLERRLRVEERLRGALGRGELSVHYQPKVNVKSGEIAGAEALLRWHSPELGLVEPTEFVPLLEASGLIDSVGRWVLQQAVRDRVAWVEAGLNPPAVAVNVSPQQLQRPDFVDNVRSVLGGLGGIDLEVTETGLDLEEADAGMKDDIDGVGRKLVALRELGVRVAIDDFGTGYSSLSVLPRLPIHALKIDRAFVSSMTESSDSLAIISAVLALARSMHLRVVAEGVETAEQLKLLRLLSCDEYQGFHFSVPLPVDAFATLLRARPGRA